jgi:hypothetical protein
VTTAETQGVWNSGPVLVGGTRKGGEVERNGECTTELEKVKYREGQKQEYINDIGEIKE